jgi:hypothetical protein
MQGGEHSRVQESLLKSKGWALMITLSKAGSNSYLFRPSGLDPAAAYDVSFDNEGKRVRLSGSRPAETGLSVRLDEDHTSELILFQTPQEKRG